MPIGPIPTYQSTQKNDKNTSVTVYEEPKEQSKQFYISSYIIIAVILSIISLCAGLVLVIVAKSNKLRQETKTKVESSKDRDNEVAVPPADSIYFS